MKPILIIIFLILSNSHSIHAQPPATDKYTKKPFLVWSSKKSPPQLLSEVQQICKKLSIGEKLCRRPAEFDEMFSDSPTPMFGEAYFLKYESSVPSIIPIAFQRVSEDEVGRILKARHDAFGTNAFLNEEGDGRYRLGLTWKSIEIGDAATPSAEEALSPSAAYVEKINTYTQYYRRHQNLLLHSESDDVFGVQVEDADSILSQSNSDDLDDLSFRLACDHIPIATRELYWKIFDQAVGPYLQQRDEEPEQYSDFRKAIARLALPFVKSVLFDIEKIDGSMRLTDPESDSVLGRLNVSTKPNSPLAGQFASMSSGESRLGAILSDDAAATIHCCVKLPEDAKELLQSAAYALLIHSTSLDASHRDVTQSLAFTLLEIAGDQNTLELMVKVGWSPESDGVIYGGVQLRLNDESQFLNNLATLAKAMTADTRDAVNIVEHAGRSYLQVTLPQQQMERLTKRTSLNLTHLYMTQGHGVVWFAVGGQNAFEILPTRIQKCQESVRISSPLLSVHLHADRWLNYPHEDPSGVTRFLHSLDENVGSFPPNLGPMQGYTSEQATPVLQKARDLGGCSEIRLAVESDESGLLITGQMGRFIRNYWLARIVNQYEAALASLQLD